MPLPDLPLAWNILLFVVAAGAVWYFGNKLGAFAVSIIERTRLGTVLVGMVLLGGATSLPEIATTISAALVDEPQLAVNNLLGGAAAQMVVLAIADATHREALTSRIQKGPALTNSAFLVGFLLLAIVAIVLGDWPLGTIGVGTLVIGAAYLGVLAWTRSARVGTDRLDQGPTEGISKRFVGKTLGVTLGILCGATLLVLAAQQIVHQTGLESAMFGGFFLAGATSLPEITTVLAAMRQGRPSLAFANILGTNLLEVSLLLVADAAWVAGPILGEVGEFSIRLALLGILLTLIFMVGLSVGRMPTVARLGLDSWAVVLVYLAAFAWLGLG